MDIFFGVIWLWFWLYAVRELCESNSAKLIVDIEITLDNYFKREMGYWSAGEVATRRLVLKAPIRKPGLLLSLDSYVPMDQFEFTYLCSSQLVQCISKLLLRLLSVSEWLLKPPSYPFLERPQPYLFLFCTL